MKLRLIEKHEHHLSVSEFDPDAVKIVQRLKKAGYNSYVVGGGVRDLLLKKRPKDFDIATEASPNKIKKIIPHSRIIGKRFKIVHIYFPKGKYIETTTFRDNHETSEDEQEINEPIKRDNNYGDEQTDANRRDITINALFYDPVKQRIIDYIGGFKDLQKKTVRVIGEPDLRFAEDPIRLLRVIRHAARSGFKTEKATWASLKDNAGLIKKSSPSRLVDEIKKDLVAGALLPFFKLLSEAGLSKILFPKLNFSPKHKNAGFEEAMSHIDSLSLAAEPPAIRTILSVIYLCGSSATIFKPEVLSDPHKIRQVIEKADKTDFSEFFSVLPFPRKDILNAFSLVSLFYETLNYAIHDKAFNRSLLRFPYEIFKELFLLLKIIPMTPYDKHIIGLTSEGLRKAFSTTSNDHEDRI